MALFFGGTKIKIFINGIAYNLNIPKQPRSLMLLTSDELEIYDSNGAQLFVEEV